MNITMRYCAGVNGLVGCLSEARASSNVDAIVPMVISDASLLLRLEAVCSLLAVLILLFLVVLAVTIARLIRPKKARVDESDTRDHFWGEGSCVRSIACWRVHEDDDDELHHYLATRYIPAAGSFPPPHQINTTMGKDLHDSANKVKEGLSEGASNLKNKAAEKYDDFKASNLSTDSTKGNMMLWGTAGATAGIMLSLFAFKNASISTRVCFIIIIWVGVLLMLLF